ncbi:MAG: DUF4382 domain-containing protein [Bacteroidota bacterium]
MKKKNLLNVFILSILSMFLIFSCSDSTSPEGNGILSLYLTDAPSSYDAVNITFSEVSAHLVPDWIPVVGDTVTANLLDFNNGETLLLGSESLPAGKYTQIRLHISDASITVDGVPASMTVPSGELKFGPQFTIEEGMTYELVIDFDASRSVVVSGTEENPEYKLKPHIRVVPKARTGSISGNVTNHEFNPIAYAIQGTDTVTSSIVKDDGTFILGFLEAGTYQVDIEDSDDPIKTNSIFDVEVSVGESTDLADITLQ